MKNNRPTLVISSFVIAISMVALKPVNAKDLSEHGFECDPKNLYNHAPPSQSYGKDAEIVNNMTYRLGVTPISVYDVPGLKDAIAVKPVSGTTPMFKDDPEFEGIIVDSRHMDINVDVTREEIADMKRDKKDTPSFIKQGKERRYGLLAHEVAHMLLPADLYGLMGKNAEKKEIAAKSLRINIQEMLDHLHKMQPRSRDPDTARRLMNEMAADYVSGVILRYMNVGTHGITYMLTMYHAASDYKKCWKSHPDPLERVKYIEAGYQDHIFE